MQEINVINTEAEIIVNLDKIIKYHQGSKLYLHDSNDNTNYKTDITIKSIIEKSEGNSAIKKDYLYFEIADRFLPDNTHKYNLLGLVKNLIELEWGYYLTHKKEGKNEINELKILSSIIKELKILLNLIHEKNNINVETLINLKENKSFGKIYKRYDVPGMQIKLERPYENKQIIELLIRNRKTELIELAQIHLPNIDFNSLNWSDSDLDEILEMTNQPFRDFRAVWLFGKLVSESILNYLKGEIDWKQGDIEITKDQGVIIYTLLIIFNLIDFEVEKEHLKNGIDDTGKAKYIRSYFRKDLKNSEEMFYTILESRN